MRPLLKLKNKAIQLRKKGLSYNEIRNQIGVAKSSLSLWLKDIELEEKHKARLYTKQVEVLTRGPSSQKERRAKEIEVILAAAKSEIVTPFKTETLRMMGTMLYWAEGRKLKGGMELTNSDPLLISFFVKWLKDIFDINPWELRMRLNIYSQQNEDNLKKFWSDLTGIPLHNFRKSFVKPRNKFFKKNTLYYGTARIEVPKSTDKKHRLYGWIIKAMEDLHPKVDLVWRKWQSLKEAKRPVNI